jgi:hypothetical protein
MMEDTQAGMLLVVLANHSLSSRFVHLARTVGPQLLQLQPVAEAVTVDNINAWEVEGLVQIAGSAQAADMLGIEQANANLLTLVSYARTTASGSDCSSRCLPPAAALASPRCSSHPAQPSSAPPSRTYPRRWRPAWRQTAEP